MLRPYQTIAVDAVFRHWAAGRSVCLVAPTGSGKTVMAEEIIRRGSGATLFLTHTKDLVEQSARRFSDAGIATGIIAAGYPKSNGCRVYVASVQTIVSRGLMPMCEQIIADECHHFASDDWRAVLAQYPFTPLVGCTATPERGDGRPLGDIFQELVVAAHYSELTEDGYLVPVRLLRPESELDKGVAKDPVDVYLTQGEGRQTFMFLRTVELAKECAERLNQLGIASACIEADTPKVERAKLLNQFRAGHLRVLTNMYALTEGVDVPAASCCILARPMGHVSTYLQAAGRVLRTAPGKVDALVIDLPGMSHRFGPPNEDRDYCLSGEGGILRKAGVSLKVCLKCGMTFKSALICPRCGFSNPQDKVKAPRVYNTELHELFNGPGTPEWVKKAELRRLEGIAHARGYGDSWAAAQFKATFAELPQAWAPGDDRKKAEYLRLVRWAESKGYAVGSAAHRYKATYGAFPPREWLKEIQG